MDQLKKIESDVQAFFINVFLNLNSFVGGISGAHLVYITGKQVTQVGNTLKAGQ